MLWIALGAVVLIVFIQLSNVRHNRRRKRRQERRHNFGDRIRSRPKGNYPDAHHSDGETNRDPKS